MQAIWRKVDEIFFRGQYDSAHLKAINILALITLFLGGIGHWVLFYKSISLNALDWPFPKGYYFALQKALTEYTIPYHTSNALHSGAGQKFLAIPETILSPQIVLLKFMSVAEFMLVNQLIVYSIGFLGCVAIKRKYKLSLFTFSFLFLIFNFNGYILSHISVGHYMWNGYFFLPFFCALILSLAEGDLSVRTAIKLAVALLFVIMQGSFHMYIWCLLFLGFIGISQKKYWRPILSTLLFTGLLCAFRLLPAIVTHHNLKRYPSEGYHTITDLLFSFTVIGKIGVFGESWWEYDAYIGILGFALIAYFGVLVYFRKESQFRDCQYRALDLPIALMVLSSVGLFYTLLARLPLPFFGAEAIVTRFIVIPLLMLLFISCIRLQQSLNTFEQTPLTRILSLAMLLQMAVEFKNHTLYSVIMYNRIHDGLDTSGDNLLLWRNVFNTYPNETLMPAVELINLADPFYKSVVNVSYLISILSLLALCFLFFRSKQAKSVSQI